MTGPTTAKEPGTSESTSYFAPGGQFTLTEHDDGPLRGVTVAVKDLYDVAGHVTGAGNPSLARTSAPAARHSTAVGLLLGAGATVIGKTATDELAAGMFGVNSHYGTPWNPAALDRVPGGSSSGSASAVAAGDALLGLGTDTGGSIRTPASFCGLFGLRTTHDRIDRGGVRPMAPRFDTVSLLARRPAVLDAALAVLAATPARRRPIRRLVLLDDLVALADPATRALTERTAARWASQWGLELSSAALADAAGAAPLTSVFWPLMSRQLWESNGAWVLADDPELGAGIRDRILAAGEVTDDQVAAAEAERQEFVDGLAELLVDAIAVLPTAIGPAPLRSSTHDELMAFRDANLALVVPASLAGSPQLSIPSGLVDGAPIGVSILGLPGDDELLVELAERAGQDVPGEQS
ncbi:amidase [Herbiconiux moechotypicola]|uniref:Amidase n=1 Tax=Herbiconiux moechotypicola TaxID=637393 RepID=A0ABN3DL51_9MICO|nr:amidase [Herbiconiux moechotypicola]MCS5730086.1 amidase [Herbiconiux moechotypicola]